MIRFSLASFILLAACDVPGPMVIGAPTVGVYELTRRTPLDLAASLANGRDCSVARLDQGESYCAPEVPPLGVPPYCTRTLGAADCWVTPPASIPLQRGLADQPAPTAAQEAYRARRWPRSLF
jgi:hypothetical protein